MPFKVRQTAAGPTAQPFLLRFCVQALLIRTSPFMWRWPVQASMTLTQLQFPLHQALKPLWELNGRDSVVSQNLGDLSSSGALWPRSFDSLSRILTREAGAGKV